MKAPWLVLALVGCADPAIELSLRLPPTQPIGYDLSCVTAIDVDVLGHDQGSVNGAPDNHHKCVSVTGLGSWTDVRAKLANQIDLKLPDSGLAAISIVGRRGLCNDVVISNDTIFYGGAGYTGGDALAIPLAANVSCNKPQTYAVHAFDLMTLVSSHTCAAPTGTDPAAFAGTYRPTMLGDEFPAAVWEEGLGWSNGDATGAVTVAAFQAVTPTSCITMHYGSSLGDGGGCVNLAAPTLCAGAGEVEVATLGYDLGDASADSTLVSAYGAPVYGVAFEQSAAPTKTVLVGATVTLDDPSLGKVVYVAHSATKLAATDGAASTGADGMFLIYLKGGPSGVTVRAPGHRDQHYTVATSSAVGIAPYSTLIAALPPG